MNNWLWIIVAGAVAIWLWTRERHFPYKERADKISEAINSGKDIKMRYWAKSRKKYSNRTVTPLALDDTYMRAYDHFRKAERRFKVTRIKKLVVVPRTTPK
jgi:predicted DNA-binding transcriptional regulator YafY